MYACTPSHHRKAVCLATSLQKGLLAFFGCFAVAFVAIEAAAVEAEVEVEEEATLAAEVEVEVEALEASRAAVEQLVEAEPSRLPE